MADRRPNVLLVMSDQHNRRVMGCAGDPVVETPAIDRLAREGTRFSSAYCPFPLCGPSRMSFMTGRLPSSIDCLDNASQLSSDIPTFAHAFAAGGYETVIAGRMHFVGSDQLHGFDRRLVSDVTTAYVNRGWDLDPVLGDLIDTPGFSVQGIRKSGPGRTGYQAYDETVTRAAVEWLEDRAARPSAEPFLLVVGYVSPHCPFVAPPDLYAMYEGRVPQPATSDFPRERLHPEVRAQRSLADGATEEDRDRARAAYYGLCTFIDRQVAQLVTALNHAGVGNETLVVYSSDHGDQIGEHGLWWKSTFYEGSVGVPLIMSGPGVRSGMHVPANVGLVDIGPTLLDLLGLPPLPRSDGRSFRCLLDGRVEEWHDLVIAEGMSLSPGPRAMRMVRRGGWKLNVYGGNRPELFSLGDDPDEIDDRSDDPTCGAVLKSLMVEAMRRWDAESVERRMDDRTVELGMIRGHLERSAPPEPFPLWYSGPQENRVGVETPRTDREPAEAAREA